MLVSVPLAQEELSQEGVQGLLLTTQFLATGTILLVEGTNEPFQNS